MAEGKVVKSVWKPKAAARAPKVASLQGLHAHCCTGPCGQRYEDSCKEPLDDAVCGPCKHDRPWPLWRTTRLPQDCCRRHSRLATNDEVATHSLGGRSTWWICDRCKRTHPSNPEGAPSWQPQPSPS